MYEARRILEIQVAGLAAERATAEELAAISHSVLEMFALADDPEGFLAQDIEFHRAVAQASGNPILAAVVGMVGDLFKEQRRATMYRFRSDDIVASQHRAIYQAIRKGDPSKARDAMDRHLRWAEEDQRSERSEDAGNAVDSRDGKSIG